MRTVIVLPADPERLPPGGIASFVRGFIKFAPDDFEISFIGVSTGGAQRRLGRWASILAEGREVAFLPVARRATADRGRVPIALAFTVGLARYRSRIGGNQSVLQFHRPATALPLLGSAHSKVRVVHLTTEQLTSAASESRWRVARGLLARVEAASFERMDRIYVVNKEAAHAYQARFPAISERIAFVPNWVDDSIFRPLADRQRAVVRRSIAGQSSGSPIMLFAGRLERQKDPLLMLETFAHVCQNRASSLLLVAGTGSMRADLEARARSLGIATSVRFMGPVERPELARLMNAADAMIITSAYETGPTVAYESLACGLPIVATAVGEIPGLLGDPHAGEAIEERSPQTLAAAAARVLARDRALVRRACAAAARPFAATTVLDKLYADHRQLVG